MSAPAYRYIGGELVPFDGHHFRERVALPPADDWRKVVIAEYARSVGIMAHDRAREEARPGGPPTWFKPNDSRRARWRMWSTMSREQRRAVTPSPMPRIEYEVLDRHVFRAERRDEPWAPPRVIEGALYLPVGKAPTDEDRRAIDAVMAEEFWR